jgi:hypothetical protein
MITIRHTSAIALLLVIFSTPRYTSHAENNHSIKVKDSAAQTISAKIVRGYIKWIVNQTGWSIRDVPIIKTISLGELRKMFLRPSTGALIDPSGLEEIRPGALYSKDEHLIYLATSWKKDDLIDQSILVHELVHHLQMENHIQFECWGRYEAQAYELQIRWLRSQGIEDPYKLLHATRAAIDTLAECP